MTIMNLFIVTIFFTAFCPINSLLCLYQIIAPYLIQLNMPKYHILCLLLCVILYQSSAQQCWNLIPPGISWALKLQNVAGYKIGPKKLFGCIDGNICFNNPNQLYRYFNNLRFAKGCSCPPNIQSQTCTVIAKPGDNMGVKSQYSNNVLVRSFVPTLFKKITFTFKKVDNVWTVDSAVPQ